MGNCCGTDAVYLKYLQQQKTLQLQICDKDRQIKDLESRIRMAKNTDTTHKEQLEKQKGKLKETELKLRQAEQQKANYMKQLNQIRSEVEQAKQREEKLMMELQTSSIHFKNKYQAQLKALKQQSMKKEENQISAKLALDRIEKERNQLKEKIKSLQRSIAQHKNKKQSQKQDQQKQSLRQTIQRLQNLNKELQRVRSEQLNKLKMQVFFQGQVLENETQQKAFLIKQLQQMVGASIFRTKLIYRFDELNSTNFHTYIDNKQQLVLIIRTTANHIFGGWTEGPFSSYMQSNKNGLLFSLTGKRAYKLVNPNKGAIIYDKDYIIFGNSQIRLKSQQNKVQSNFAINNPFYSSGQDRFQIFTGTSARTFEIKTYQIFQLFFKPA